MSDLDIENKNKESKPRNVRLGVKPFEDFKDYCAECAISAKCEMKKDCRWCCKFEPYGVSKARKK